VDDESQDLVQYYKKVILSVTVQTFFFIILLEMRFTFITVENEFFINSLVEAV
jgi:hypothetical protein